MVLNLKAHPSTGIGYLSSSPAIGADKLSKWLDPRGYIDDAEQNDQDITLYQVREKRGQK